MNYIVYGELLPRIKRRVNAILKEKIGSPDEFNVVRIDFDNSSVAEIKEEASFFPLGYDKKVIIVSNPSFLRKDGKDEDKNIILDLVKNTEPDITLIFVENDSKLDVKGEIYKYLLENGKIDYFEAPTPEQWIGYIKKYFTSRNVTIDADAVNELAKRVDGDLTKFENEAEKLLLYTNNITLLDVVTMVSKPLEDDAFQIANALFKGDNSLAISIYRDLKKLGTKFVDTLIPLLANQFRFIAQAKFLDARGLDRHEIASELGTSDFRVKIVLNESRSIKRIQIAHALDDLYNLDYQIKSGQIDRSYGLELFLINFPN